MTNPLYFAKDGNYGSAEGLVTIDPSTLGFPIPESFWDEVHEYDRPRVATSLIGEGGRLIRIMRDLLIPNHQDAEAEFPEYFRGQVEALMDFLGITYESAQALLKMKD